MFRRSVTNPKSFQLRVLLISIFVAETNDIVIVIVITRDYVVSFVAGAVMIGEEQHRNKMKTNPIVFDFHSVKRARVMYASGELRGHNLG